MVANANQLRVTPHKKNFDPDQSIPRARWLGYTDEAAVAIGAFRKISAKLGVVREVSWTIVVLR